LSFIFFRRNSSSWSNRKTSPAPNSTNPGFTQNLATTLKRRW
jgi:hypothetical protein